MTNLGLFKISFSTLWLGEKVPDLSHLGANLTQFGCQIWPPRAALYGGAWTTQAARTNRYSFGGNLHEIPPEHPDSAIWGNKQDWWLFIYSSDNMLDMIMFVMIMFNVGTCVLVLHMFDMIMFVIIMFNVGTCVLVLHAVFTEHSKQKRRDLK